MGIITKIRKQDAVYFPRAGVDAHGKPAWGIPVEISCRWEQRTEEVVDVDGVRNTSQAHVYTSQNLVVGGYLVQGTLSTLPNPTDPTKNVNGGRVLLSTTTPNLRATEFLYESYIGVKIS